MNAKTSEDIRLVANKELANKGESLRAQTRSVVTVSINLSEANLSANEAQLLIVELVDTWALQSIDRGLMNEDISRPVAVYSIANESNLLDAFEGMTKYVDSLKTSIEQLEKIAW